MINFHPWYGMTENQILEEIGKRLKQIRLNLDISQKELGEKIGKTAGDMSNIENGKPVTLKSFIRILRALEKLENLDNAIQSPSVSPMKMLKLKERQKKRASKKGK